MQRAIQIATLAALTAIVALAVEGVIALHSLRPRAAVTLDNLDRTIIIAGVAATHLEKASDVWEKASAEQSSKTLAVLSDANVAVNRFSTFISRTDSSLNLSLAPALMQSVQQQNVSLLETQVALRSSLSRVESTVGDIDSRVNDPAIASSVHRIDMAAGEMVESMANVKATTADIKQVADKVREDYLKPQKFAWALVKELAGFGGSIANMIK